MDELIARVAGAIGVETDLAKTAVGHVLAFLQKEFPEGAVADLLARLPGAQETIDAAAASESDNGGGGLLGGLMASAGGLMGLAAKLSSLGLDMGQIQTLAREVLGYAEGLIGREKVEEIANSIPGLSQFI